MPRKVDVALLKEREQRARARAEATRKQLALAHHRTQQAEHAARRARWEALGEAVEQSGCGGLTPAQLLRLLTTLWETGTVTLDPTVTGSLEGHRAPRLAPALAPDTAQAIPGEGDLVSVPVQAVHATAFLCEQR